MVREYNADDVYSNVFTYPSLSNTGSWPKRLILRQGMEWKAFPSSICYHGCSTTSFGCLLFCMMVVKSVDVHTLGNAC
jgi:hypothetical protein